MSPEWVVGADTVIVNCRNKQWFSAHFSIFIWLGCINMYRSYLTLRNV